MLGLGKVGFRSIQKKFPPYPDKIEERNLTIYFHLGATSFMASATRHLPPTDAWCILYPSLKYSLRSDVKQINEKTLLGALKPPVCPFRPFHHFLFPVLSSLTPFFFLFSGNELINSFIFS